HIDVPSGTVAPQRMQLWVSSVVGGEALGVTSSWCHGPGSTPEDRRSAGLPAIGRGHERVDVGGRPDGHDGTVRPGRLPARPGLTRRLDPRAPGQRLLASPELAVEPDDHELVLAAPAAGLERLEIGR